jgi:HPr kinase/phosphorylase
MTDSENILHATCVAISGRAALIIGPSGSGKSSLGLQLLAFGAELVADDRTCVIRQDSVVAASPPPTIAGLIEARGVGLLELPYLSAVPVALVIDLAQPERDRLPQLHRHAVLGIDLPCLHNPDSPHFAAAIALYMSGSRRVPRP